MSQLKVNIFNIVTDRRAARDPDGYAVALKTLVDEIVLAEQLGYERYWLAEHHFEHESWEIMPNPLKVFDHAAALTSTIRFGTAVTILPWWQPLRLAEDVALTDQLTGGRLDVGVGRGYQVREHGAFGTPIEEEENREIFAETIDILRAAWSNPTFSYEGKHFRIPSAGDDRYFTAELARDRALGDEENWGYVTGRDPIPAGTPRTVSLVPRPLQQPHPPLWQGCFSLKSAEFAARNRLRGLFVYANDEYMAALIETYVSAARDAGWTPGPEDIVAGLPIHIAETDRAARDEMEPFMKRFAYMFEPLGFLAPLARAGEEVPGPAEITYEYFVERVCLYGAVETVAERCSRFMEMVSQFGVTQFFTWPLTDVPAQRVRTLELFAEKVRPEVERAVTAAAVTTPSQAERAGGGVVG